MPHDGGVALGTELAVVGRIGRVTLDLVDDAVIRYVDDRSAGVQAHLAGAADPFALLEGVLYVVLYSSHCKHSWLNQRD
jgi:hypothetical protein